MCFSIVSFLVWLKCTWKECLVPHKITFATINYFHNVNIYAVCCFFAHIDNGMPPRLPMSRSPTIDEFTICFGCLFWVYKTTCEYIQRIFFSNGCEFAWIFNFDSHKFHSQEKRHTSNQISELCCEPHGTDTIQRSFCMKKSFASWMWMRMYCCLYQSVIRPRRWRWHMQN